MTLNSVERLDTREGNKCVFVQAMSQSRWHAAAMQHNGKIYVSGEMGADSQQASSRCLRLKFIFKRLSAIFCGYFHYFLIWRSIFVKINSIFCLLKTPILLFLILLIFQIPTNKTHFSDVNHVQTNGTTDPKWTSRVQIIPLYPTRIVCWSLEAKRN